jgi:hypothetical protein
MAVLNDRAMGIMDFISRAGADLITPPNASPVFRPTSPMQQAMKRPQVQMSQDGGQMATMLPSGEIAMASPVIPTMGAQMGASRPSMPQPELMEQAAKAKALIDRTGGEIEKDPSFRSTVQEFFGNRENMLRLALGFNTMRLTPDQGLAATIGDELKDIRATRVNSKTAIAVSKRLRQMGYNEYADMVESNPALAKEVMTQIMQKELKPDVAIKTSAPQIDQTTGQLFVIETNPNTGKVRRINVQGAMGLTEEAKQALIVNSEDKANDIKAAQEAGRVAFSRASQLDSQIGRLNNAKSALQAGAVSGWIEQFLPAMDAATADLRATANSLGIDIINSATFGALSEKELTLALSTGLAINLPEKELMVYIQEKIEAQNKLRNELLKDARDLVGGQTRYSDYIKRRADQALGSQSGRPSTTTQPQSQPPEVIRYDAQGKRI